MRQIAQMPTEHSWLAERIVKSQDLDELEDSLWSWLKPKALSMTKDDNYVWRMVRDSFIPLLEKEAIEAFLSQNPQWMGYLPEVSSPWEAVELASMELLYVEESQKQEAREILESLLQEVMPPSTQASSDLQN